MARSRKKTPGFVDHSRTTFKDKRFANKKVRNTENVPNGGAYKKLYCSWNIKDWTWLYFSEREVQESWQAKEGRRYKLFIK